MFPDSSGGSSPGAGEGLRADWQIRMNVSHSNGFVGGAGRLLIHNATNEERNEIVLFLPANVRPDEPGNIRLLSAVVCSAKPGIPAAPGAPLVLQARGARASVTIPLLRLNDWIYVDLTWDGSFPVGGASFQNGVVPLGKFHPQLAVDIDRNGQAALFPIPARYDVTLGTDPGAKVIMYAEGSPVTNDDGQAAEHTFRSYGKPDIQAGLAAPGTVTGAVL